jgi:hypothetical protein
MLMKPGRNKMKYLRLLLTITGLFICLSSPVFAVLGNSIEENELVYGVPKSVPKYHYSGSKDVVIYKTGNAVVTVVYRDNISILENISYTLGVECAIAEEDIRQFILPEKIEKPKFTSTMPFAEAYFVENIYQDGIKTKIIYNTEGKATEIISSVTTTVQLAKDKPDE